MSAVLFVTGGLGDLLKAHKKLVTVPGHVRRGKWVDPYQMNVLVSDDHDTDKVASGQGSFYQKQAHKKLAEKVENFSTMNPDAKATLVMAHATKLQAEASASAALSQWKKLANAGQNPKPAMWAAFYAQDAEGKKALLAQVEAKAGGLDHLHAPSNPDLQPAPKTATTATPQAATAGRVETLKDWPGTQFKLNADGKWESHHSTGTSAPTGPELSATLFIKIGKPVPPDVAAMLSEKSKAAIIKDAAAEFGVSPMVAQGLMMGYHNGDPWDEKNLKEGDTKVEDGKTYVLQGGRWHLMTEHPSQGGLIKKFDCPNGMTVSVVHGVGHQAGMFVVVTEDENKNFIEQVNHPSESAALKDAKHEAEKFGFSSQPIQAAAAPAPAVTVSVPPSGIDPAAAVAAMETGAYYQKEAIKKLKAEHGAAWAAMHPAHQHELATAKYKALQGAASQAAAVSGWKKNLLAGKPPTPSELLAVANMAKDGNPEKVAKLVDEVSKVIGQDKFLALITQGNAKIKKAPGSVQNPAEASASGSSSAIKKEPESAASPLAGSSPFKHLSQAEDAGGVGAIKPAIGAWMAANPGGEAKINQALADLGYSTLKVPEPGAAPVASPLSGKPAYDHLAHAISAGAFADSAAKKWIAANPGAWDELNDALAEHGYSHLATFGPDGQEDEDEAAAPAAPAGGLPSNKDNAAYQKFEGKPGQSEIQSLILMFKLHGGKLTEGLDVADLVDPPEAAAYDALDLQGKADVAAAVAYYGPAKLKVFQEWLSAHLASKAAAPAAPAKVNALKTTMHNTTAGHFKSWSVYVDGTSLVTEYGKIGAKQQKTIKHFSSSIDAAKAADLLIAAKKKGGYSVMEQGLHEVDSVAGGDAQASTAPAPSVAQPEAAPALKGKAKKVAAIVPSEISEWLAAAPGKGNGDAAFWGLANSVDNTKFHKWVGSAKKNPHSHWKNLYTATAIASLMGKHDQFLGSDGIFHPVAGAGEVKAAGAVTDPAKIQAAVLVDLAGSPVANTAQPVGPKDGDTKPGADGGTLVFKGGRWHKQANDGGSGEWDYSSSDSGMSGAKTLTKDGGTLAFDPSDGQAEWHAPYSDGDDAITAESLAGLLKEMADIGVKIPPLAMLQKLDPGIQQKDLPGAKQAQPTTADSVVVPDFNALSPGKYGAMYTAVSDALVTAVNTGGLKALKSLVVFHKNGSVTIEAAGYKLKGMQAVSTAKDPQKKARQDAIHKLVMDLKAAAAKAGKNGAPKVFVTAAPAAANPSPAPAAAAAPKAPAIKVGGLSVTSIDGWPQTGPQKGSNPGGKFKDKQGVEWYCKFPADKDVALNEILAAKFYQMLGVQVPMLKLVSQNGKVGIASKWVDGMSKGSAAQLSKAPGAHDAFAIDAWLANWDVVGAANDNLLLGKDGAAVRVDVGGSLVYRAMGGVKGADFGDAVPELDTLKDPAKNDKSAAVFGSITPESMQWGLRQLNKMKPSQITELCEKIGPGSAAEKAALAAKLIARRAFILKKFAIRDQWEALKKIDLTKLTVNPSDLPAPIDFVNFHGPGKGLSSKSHVNEQNAKDSAALIAFAAAGNLTALKDYHYQAFNKETGAPEGLKSIKLHPSGKVQSQWAELCDLLTSVAHPPVYGLDLPPIGGGSVAEVSEAAGFFHPGETVATVPPENVVGFWLKLGHVGKESVADLVPEKISYYKAAGEAKVKQWYKACKSNVKALMSNIQGSGYWNHIWTEGLASIKLNGSDVPLQKLATEVYDDAVIHPEGTTIHRWMNMSQVMMDQLLKEGAGLVLQNTDSMCCSVFKNWGDNSHFGNGAFLKIRYAEGAKALDTYGSGSFHSNSVDSDGHHVYKGVGEMEVTTLMGARFVVLDIKKGNASSSSGITMELLMLPPHEGYLSSMKSMAALGKSVVVFFGSLFKKAA